jgi:hypothetical protein
VEWGGVKELLERVTVGTPVGKVEVCVFMDGTVQVIYPDRDDDQRFVEVRVVNERKRAWWGRAS